MSLVICEHNVAKNGRLVKTITIHNFLIPSDYNKDRDFTMF